MQDELVKRLCFVENEICRLRRENRQLKFAVIVAIIVALLPYLIAAQLETATFKVVSAERFEVVDGTKTVGAISYHKQPNSDALAVFIDGKRIAQFENLRGIHVFSIPNEEGKPIVTLSGAKVGGVVGISNNEGKTVVLLSSSLGDGYLGISNKEGKTVASLGRLLGGGCLGISNNEGRTVALLSSPLGDGRLVISNKEGEPVVSLGSSFGDGRLVISNKEGKDVVTLSSDENGGRLQILNPKSRSDKCAVFAGVAPNGAGAIGTTDVWGKLLWTSPLW